MNQSPRPSSPNEILARQARIAPALNYLGSFRYRPVQVQEEVLPISDEEVAAWIERHPFVRSVLAPHVARSLAFIDSFRGRR